MTNYTEEEEEYHNIPTTTISYNTGSININECSLQTIWTSTNNSTTNIPNIMPVSDSSNSTLTNTTTEDGEEENNLIDSSQCVNLDTDLVSSASESSLLDTNIKPTNANNHNQDTTNNNNVRQRFAEQKLSDSITLRLSDLSSKTPPIFARDDMNMGDLRGSFTRDDTPRRGTLIGGSSSSPLKEVPKEETKAETSRQCTTEQFEDSNNTVLNTPFDTTTGGEEEESVPFDTSNNLFRRQSTGVTSNYDTYTNYDPVESVVGGYSTLDVSRRSSTYGGGCGGLDYSKRSGSCGLFSIYDDVDNNGTEENGGRPVPIWIKNKASSRNKTASVQSGHTELMKQHSLVDWAEYPTSPADEEEDDLNASEDFADDDVSEEHYRSLDRRCSINNKDKGVSSTKEDMNDKQEKGEEVSNQLVVRGVLDPEEASFAEQERLTEYDETKAVIVPDSTPIVPDTKTPSSKGIEQQSQSPQSATSTVKHTNDNNKPIDTSKQYNGFQHTFITFKEEHRFLMLYTFLKRNVNAKIIIFFSTTKSTQYYCKLLQRLKFRNVNCVHNGMGRDRFMNALVEFSKSSSVSAVGEGDSEGGGNNKGSILCIPDFQASDISIPPSTTWLVQFEPPANPTEYIYRVGRISSETTTASNSSSSHRRTRSNSTGGGSNSNNHPTTQNPSRALLFLTPNEYGFLKYYKAANIKIYEYEISKIAKIQKQIVKLVADDNKLHKLGVEAYHAYLGTYASHEYKDIYNSKEEEGTEDNFETLIAKCFGFESIPGKVIPSTKRVASNNRKSFKRNDSLRRSLVKKQDSKDKLRGSLVKKRDSKDRVVPQEDEEKVTTTPQGRNKSKVSQDEKKVTTPQDNNKKKKVPQDNSPRASRSREQNRWKPVKHEQHASWMSGKTKSWRASNVHADKMKIQSKKNLDEYHPKIVKLPKAA